MFSAFFTNTDNPFSTTNYLTFFTYFFNRGAHFHKIKIKNQNVKHIIQKNKLNIIYQFKSILDNALVIFSLMFTLSIKF
jgi:hypothetical protein